MDPRFVISREEFNNVQMDVKQVQFVQQAHAERLLRLEKRQADDAALKSVWNSPFPSVLGGTPQHGPVHIPSNEVFDGLDDEGQNLLGSLHLDADDEPIRRGAASRANSVRFDESALHGSSWAGHSGRHSGEFGPIRPSSGLGSHTMMERSLSHKSDGRHSSAGHSVHSMHSGVSGRASLGLDTHFIIGGRDDDSPLEFPEPPPGFFYLGSVPSIIRCWLTTDFTSSTMLYAVICTGSQRSTVDYSLIKELRLLNDIHRDVDGVDRIRLAVYLPEARVTQSNSRSSSPAPQLPSMSASFEVTSTDKSSVAESKQSIRIFIGSDTLRLHSADILLSQNLMTLYGNDRDKVSVPFVRPEDDVLFKHLATTNVIPQKTKLKATAAEFVFKGETPKASPQDEDLAISQLKNGENGTQGPLSPTTSQINHTGKATEAGTNSESGADSEKQAMDTNAATDQPTKDTNPGSTDNTGCREPSTAIWGPWRQGASTNSSSDGLSGYQPAGRGTRGMKVLKASKSSGSSSSARTTGSTYEPSPPTRTSGELRRKSQASNLTAENGNGSASGSASGSGSVGGTARWESKRSFGGTVVGGGANTNSGGASKLQSAGHDTVKGGPVPRSANPLGNASAFASWMTSASKPKTAATTVE